MAVSCFAWTNLPTNPPFAFLEPVTLARITGGVRFMATWSSFVVAILRFALDPGSSACWSSKRLLVVLAEQLHLALVPVGPRPALRSPPSASGFGPCGSVTKLSAHACGSRLWPSAQVLVVLALIVSIYLCIYLMHLSIYLSVDLIFSME